MKQISVLIKPASSLCNLRCRYCFYTDVSRNREVFSDGIMEEETAEKLTAACGEDLLFVIFGDLETDSRYAERLLACSKETLFTFDEDGDTVTITSDVYSPAS